MDGPYITEVSKGMYHAYLEINILVQRVVSDTDFHRFQQLIGIITTAFTDFIVYKYGDDDSFVACFKLLQNTRKRERIQVSNFGIVEQAKPLQQATVEGHYLGELTE